MATNRYDGIVGSRQLPAKYVDSASCSSRRKFTENPLARGNSSENRARFAGQNSTRVGSSDSDETALAVIA